MKKSRKKVISFFTALCMLAAAGMPGTVGTEVEAAQADLTNGLAGYWTFDGNSMENKAPASTQKAEIVGTGVTLQQEGSLSGYSAYFSKQTNSNIKLENAINTATQDFSLAAWVKYDADTFTNGNNVNLFQQTGDGKTILYLRGTRTYGTYVTGVESDCNQTIPLETWHHVVFTCNHTTKKVQFYVNGELVNTNTLTGDFVNATTDILIGSHKDSSTSQGSIKGYVDELRFYTTVVTAEMAEAMYEQHADPQDQIDTLKALVEKAKTLSGFDDAEAEKNLKAKIQEAEAYINGSDWTISRIRELCAELEEAMAACRETDTIDIAVNTSKELREIGRHMFGVNHRYHNNGYGSWNAEEGKIEEQFNEYAKEANFGSIRYPGGTVSNLFDWKKSIGPVSQRKKTIHGQPSSEPITPNFGVDEAMTWIYDELGSDAVWVYGMGQGNAADAADLFEYLNAPSDGDATNPNGGTDWAEVRAANGHKEPYGVKNFEIGNEICYPGQSYWVPDNTNPQDPLEQAGYYINGCEVSFGSGTDTVKEEDWRASAAISDGSADQVRYVKYVPVKENSVKVYVNGVEWSVVDSLEGRGTQNVCTVDYKTGKITFGNGSTTGNKPASGARIRASYTAVMDGFLKYYEALHTTAEAIGADVNVYCGYYYGENFVKKMAEEKKNDCYEGVVIHPYSDSNNSSTVPDGDPDFYNKILGRSLEYNITRVQNLVNCMNQYAPDMGKVPVLSEFGVFSYNNQFVRSIGHAVYIANEMIDYVNLGTPYINKHCLADYPYGGDSLGPGAQCVIQTIVNSDGTHSFVSTPSAKMFSIFNNLTGTTEVDQTVTGNDTYYTFRGYNVPTVKMLSTTDEEGNTYLTIVNNRKDEETAIRVSVDSRDLSGIEAEVWYLTSEKEDDENTLQEPNKVDVKKTTMMLEGTSFTYQLAPHSITSFRIPQAEKESLRSLYEEYSKLKAEEYLAESWEAFSAVMEEAKEVLDGSGAGQAEVDELTVTLQQAYDSLLPASLPYDDVETKVEGNQWYYNAVAEMWKKNYMTGKTKTIFAPGENIARAQLAVILYRIEFSRDPDKTIEEKSPFEDVERDTSNKWYKEAVIWASSTKVPGEEKTIITGYTNPQPPSFRPNNNITREELATMLYRYAKCKGIVDEAGKNTWQQEFEKFPDNGKVTVYAKEAMAWCVGNQIITGDRGNLNPQGNANRAQSAVMLSRFINLSNWTAENEN